MKASLIKYQLTNLIDHDHYVFLPVQILKLVSQQLERSCSLAGPSVCMW